MLLQNIWCDSIDTYKKTTCCTLLYLVAHNISRLYFVSLREFPEATKNVCAAEWVRPMLHIVPSSAFLAHRGKDTITSNAHRCPPHLWDKMWRPNNFRKCGSTNASKRPSTESNENMNFGKNNMISNVRTQNVCDPSCREKGKNRDLPWELRCEWKWLHQRQTSKRFSCVNLITFSDSSADLSSRGRPSPPPRSVSAYYSTNTRSTSLSKATKVYRRISTRRINEQSKQCYKHFYARRKIPHTKNSPFSTNFRTALTHADTHTHTTQTSTDHTVTLMGFKTP